MGLVPVANVAGWVPLSLVNPSLSNLLSSSAVYDGVVDDHTLIQFCFGFDSFGEAEQTRALPESTRENPRAGSFARFRVKPVLNGTSRFSNLPKFKFWGFVFEVNFEKWLARW